MQVKSGILPQNAAVSGQILPDPQELTSSRHLSCFSLKQSSRPQPHGHHAPIIASFVPTLLQSPARLLPAAKNRIFLTHGHEDEHPIRTPFVQKNSPVTSLTSPGPGCPGQACTVMLLALFLTPRGSRGVRISFPDAATRTWSGVFPEPGHAPWPIGRSSHGREDP